MESFLTQEQQGARGKTKFSPLEIEAIQIMDGINYYAQRGVDEGEYCRAHTEIAPYYNTIIHIAGAFDDINKHGGKGVSRISQGITPVGLFETYKFLKDVTDDLKKIAADEGKKTINPVHIHKSLIRTGYAPLIKDNMDYYSYYPGHDFDLETAKLELGFPTN